MDIKIIASTNLEHVPTKTEMDRIAGLTAGVCYLPDTIDKLFAEDETKTFRRADTTKKSGHHSPNDHAWISLQLDNIPKIVAMVLNNEKMYATSEKSARYKRMPLSDEEQELYDKWSAIFVKEINKIKKGYENWFTDKRIDKLAQENARYLTSVFTPTSMIYSTSYRQLNILYSLINREIDELDAERNYFCVALRESLIDFNTQLEELVGFDKKPLLDDQLSDNRKGRRLSFFRNDTRPVVKQVGEVYCLAYWGSFAQLAQAQRHRTISYSVVNDSVFSDMYYIPPILKNDDKLVNLWLEDCESVFDLTPQGRMLRIVEKGELSDFVLKAKERLCSFADSAIHNQTRKSAEELHQGLVEAGSPYAEDLEPLLKGSRCTFGYKCEAPCGYAPGVKGERIV